MKHILVVSLIVKYCVFTINTSTPDKNHTQPGSGSGRTGDTSDNVTGSDTGSTFVNYNVKLSEDYESVYTKKFLTTPLTLVEDNLPIDNTSSQNNYFSERKCEPLNKFIKCYENVTATQINSSAEEIDFNLNLFGHLYRIQLFGNVAAVLQGSGVLVKSMNHHGQQVFNHKNSYFFGGVKNTPSEIHGTFDKNNQIFSGVIHFNINDTFYIEPAKTYFRNSPRKKMVAYKETDVNYNALKSQKIVSSKEKRSIHRTSSTNDSHQLPHNLYYKKPKAEKLTNLQKLRQSCELSVFVDHTYFINIGKSRLEDTVNEVIYHVTEADYIFRHSDFNGNSLGDNVGFSIKEIVVFESSNAEDYKVSDTSDNVETVLDKFSLYNFDDVCLAALFTYRDFADGVIGLAWMASSSIWDAPGGICQQGLVYDAEKYNFNTLLLSGINFGQTIPKMLLSLTLTHELGHSFGAPHDDENRKVCAPGGIDGFYLMHPHSTDADKPNNNQFSPCSLSSIGPVIAHKGGCLIEEIGDTCGNRIIEEGEECDCGYSTTHCQLVDKCCTPASNESVYGCRFNRPEGKFCSPKLSPCCSESCTYELLNASRVCREASECYKESVCSGSSAECPPVENLPNGKPCHNNKGICVDGKCTQNFCSLHGLHECQCTDNKHMCELCCLCIKETENGWTYVSPCVPASALGIFLTVDNISHTIYSPPGKACNKYKGYCSQNHTCVSVDLAGALNRLESLFAPKTWDLVTGWFMNNWYILLSFALAIIVCGGIFINRFHKKESANTLAYKASRIAALHNKAESQLTELKREFDCLNISYMLKKQEISDPGPVDSIVAIARMCTFFPDVDRSIIISVVKESPSEEAAVRMLLLKGYSIRSFYEEECIGLR